MLYFDSHCQALHENLAMPSTPTQGGIVQEITNYVNPLLVQCTRVQHSSRRFSATFVRVFLSTDRKHRHIRKSCTQTPGAGGGLLAPQPNSVTVPLVVVRSQCA